MEEEVHAIAVLNESEFAVSSSNGLILMYHIVDNQIQLNENKFGDEKQKQNKMLHDSKICALTFSKDGSILASGDISGEIRVWKMPNGKCLRKLSAAQNGDGAPVQSILITEDKQKLYAYTSDM